jgi:hypothetical protein
VSSQGWRCWATAATALGRPARRCALPATPRRSSRSRSTARCRAGHHPRLPHRHPSRHPQVPSGRDRVDYQLRAGQLRPALPGVSAASALHHRQAWPHHPVALLRGRAARRAAAGGDPQLPGELPALAADGGALDRLAGRCRLPAVPYRGIERNEAWWSLRGRRGKPATAAGAWSYPPRRRLGRGLTHAVTQRVLADLVGRSESWLSQVERGIRSVDRMSVMVDLASVLHVKVIDLTGQPLSLAPNGGVEFIPSMTSATRCCPTT